jgi:FAD/FMN-containing dehydrogenase
MALSAPAGFRGVFRADDDARAVYSEAAGIGRAWPAAVAVPVDADDVALLVRWARDNNQPLIPRGSGSSMSGAAIGSGVIVDVSRLRQIGVADADLLRIRVEAGALRGHVDRAAAKAGLRFPVDPSSGEFCTIGGMASTNAAGPHSLQLGSMRRWVTALECVFDDGARATIRRGAPLPKVAALSRFMRDAHPAIAKANPASLSRAGVLKDSSGYGVAAYAESHDVIDLLVGSEGTLMIVTAVELSLVPTATATRSLLLAFSNLERAVEAAVAAKAAGAAACELLDRTFLGIARTAGTPLPVPDDTEAVLLIETESETERWADVTIQRLRTALQTFGPTAEHVGRDARSEDALWEFRHAASPAIAKMDARLKSMQFIEDAAIPPSAVAAYVRGVRRILEANDTAVVIFGHAGDAHIHVNPLVDVLDARWRERVERILRDVTALVVELGGTLSGEHGDGRLRAPLLARTWSDGAMDLFGHVKRAFDPGGVFNPGAKIALDGQRAIEDVKYDPALASLPASARRALDTVERERAYSRLRLDLL